LTENAQTATVETARAVAALMDRLDFPCTVEASSDGNTCALQLKHGGNAYLIQLKDSYDAMAWRKEATGL